MGTQAYCLFDTKAGRCGVGWSDAGLTRVQLPEADGAETEERLQRFTGATLASAPPAVIAEVIDALTRYFEGVVTDFGFVAVDYGRVAESEVRVYDALRKVGWANTTSYGALAETVGAPEAAQAIGRTMGRNPVPIVVPCHRVLAAGGHRRLLRLWRSTHQGAPPRPRRRGRRRPGGSARPRALIETAQAGSFARTSFRTIVAPSTIAFILP